MPSLGDSVFIFVLALMLFGPKKLPQLARQLGKLMAEFRRASNEFRMQMEDELRVEEQKEHKAKVEAMEGPASDIPDPEHPHLPAAIAESGDLKMMPPSTGLPVENGSYGSRSSYGDTPAPETIPEHTIQQPYTGLGAGPETGPRNELPCEPGYGASSEEPAAEAAPAVHPDGEHATHA